MLFGVRSSPHLSANKRWSTHNIVVVVGFNLFGDGLRDTLDPRLRQ
jgi:hypothetical protein